MPIWKRGPQTQDPATARAHAAVAEIAALNAMRFSGSTTFSNRPRPATNIGVKDLADNAVHQFLTVDDGTTEAIIKRDVAYLRLDEATAAAVGKAWVGRRYAAPRLDALVGTEVVGTAITSAHTITDLGRTPTDEGELWRIQAEFRPVRSGDPQVRQLSELVKAFQADGVVVDLYFDDATRLRRYRITWADVSALDPNVGRFVMTLVRDYFDFDVQPDITLPPASDVLMQAHLPADLKTHPPLSYVAARPSSTESS